MFEHGPCFVVLKYFFYWSSNTIANCVRYRFTSTAHRYSTFNKCESNGFVHLFVARTIAKSHRFKTFSFSMHSRHTNWASVVLLLLLSHRQHHHMFCFTKMGIPSNQSIIIISNRLSAFFFFCFKSIFIAYSMVIEFSLFYIKWRLSGFALMVTPHTLRHVPKGQSYIFRYVLIFFFPHNIPFHLIDRRFWKHIFCLVKSKHFLLNSI